MQIKRRVSRVQRRLVVGIVAVCSAVAVAGLTFGAINASTVEGCQPVGVSSITESGEFTPYGERYSQIPDRPINPRGLASASIPGEAPLTLDGLPVSWVARAPGFTETLYLGDAIGVSMTHPEFYAAGGLAVFSNQADSQAGSHVEALKAQLGRRVTVVRIGQLDAALTWADPLANGARPHQLSWWSDGVIYNLVGIRTAEQIVALGRGMVC